MRRRIPIFLAALVATALPAIVLGQPAAVRARDAVAAPGAPVEAFAAFGTAAARGSPARVTLDGRAVGAARTDINGFARLQVVAPSTPGHCALGFAVGNVAASSTLYVLDPTRPSIVVDMDSLTGTNAPGAIQAISQTADIIYF